MSTKKYVIHVGRPTAKVETDHFGQTGILRLFFWVLCCHGKKCKLYYKTGCLGKCSVGKKFSVSLKSIKLRRTILLLEKYSIGKTHFIKPNIDVLMLDKIK